jgi:hypothetical protein
MAANSGRGTAPSASWRFLIPPVSLSGSDRKFRTWLSFAGTRMVLDAFSGCFVRCLGTMAEGAGLLSRNASPL